MDGIILDSEPLHFEAYKKAFGEFGFDLNIEEYLSFGIGTGDKLPYGIAEKYPEKNIVPDALYLRKREIYKELVANDSKPRENILEVLACLKGGHKLAVASSGDEETVMFVLEKFGIADDFEVVVTRSDVANVKPSPDIYLKVIERLGVEKSECLAIEDSQVGLSSAKNAGIKCVAFPCRFTENQDFSNADAIISDFYDLLKIADL